MGYCNECLLVGQVHMDGQYVKKLFKTTTTKQTNKKPQQN